MPDVTITLKTIDQSSDKVRKVKKEYEGIAPALERAGKSVGNFVSANATLIAGVLATAAALKGSYDAFQKYAGQVRDLAAVSGTGAEEASKLLQVLDDFQISAEDVTAATRVMTKNGLTPTIETLAQLSDQYLALTDAQERNKFVIENLGRAGLQWVNVLEQGGEAIMETSEQANQSLILTDEQIEKAEKARLAVDAWADAWEGLKVSIGSGVGEIIAVNATLQDNISLYEGLTGETINFSRSQGEQTKNFERFVKEMERGKLMTEFYKNQLEQLPPVLEEVGLSQEEFSAQMSHLSDIMQTDFTDAGKEYLATMEELNAQLAEVPEADRQGVLDQIKAETEAYNERAAALMFNIQQEAIMAAAESGQIDYSDAAAAISTLAENYGLIDEKQKAVMDTTQMLIDKFAETGNLDGFTEALGYMNEVMIESPEPIEDTTRSVTSFEAKLRAALELMNQLPPSGTTWDYAFNVTGGAGGGGGGTPPPTGNGAATPFAAGGQMGNGWSLVGERGAELISPSGYVFPANVTRHLLASGTLDGVNAYASGGLSVFDRVRTAPRPGQPGSVPPVNDAPAVETAITEEIIQPIVTAVEQEVAAQSIAMTQSVIAMTQETKKTNELLMMLINKSPTAGDIGYAVAGQGNKWNG